MKFNTLLCRCISLGVVSMLLVGGFAQGVIAQTDPHRSEVTANVVNADFSQSIARFSTTDTGYHLEIDVTNTGTLTADSVEVYIQYPPQFSLDDVNMAEGVWEEVENELGKGIRGEVGVMDPESLQTVQVDLMQERYVSELPVFSYAIISPVSFPVQVEIEAETFSQPNSELITVGDRVKRWVSIPAGYVQLVLHRFIDWILSLYPQT